MKYVEFGKTGERVSALALGCRTFSEETEACSRAAVLRAYELGINFYDTADVYGWRGRQEGVSEKVLGTALRGAGVPRDQIWVASKCGIVHEGMEAAYTYKAYDLSRGYIKASYEGSLKRLGMDYLDLYQPHRMDYLTHPEETARALEELRKEGKIRYAGVSNYTPDEIRALSTYIRVESMQTAFILLHLEHLETGLASVCLEKKMAQLFSVPLSGSHGASRRGVLAGATTLSHSDWQEQREQGVIAQVSAFAEAYGLTVVQTALACLMHLPGGAIPLVGTTNPEHVAEAVRATEVELDRDDWYELLVIARGRPMPWNQRPWVYLKDH